MMTQVREDKEQLEDFKKDHGDENADYGTFVAFMVWNAGKLQQFLQKMKSWGI
jgi:hypothetical protein